MDEGYAAVTQNNGRQVILPGGEVHLLDHKNWKFEKFMTMKIQTGVCFAPLIPSPEANL